MSLIRRAVHHTRSALNYLFDGMILESGYSGADNSVLIIRLDAIGDFVLWMDAARFISRHYQSQGKRTVLLANALWADWAKELGIFDQVIPLDRRRYFHNLFYRYRLARKVQKQGCSIAIHPTYSRDWSHGDAVIRICRAKERVGFSGDLSNISSWKKRLSDRWYTRLISADAKPCMELVRNAEFVRGLTGQPYQAKVADLNTCSALPIDDDLAAQVPAGNAYYVLFPSASWSGKQWPLSRFLQVAKLLHEATGWVGVVCGGAGDVELADTMCSHTTAPLLNWVGRTNLTQLAAVIGNAKMLLANDTSATHIAPACGVPTICILGGGHYGRFMPYEVEQQDDRPLPQVVINKMSCFGCNWQCIYPRQNDDPVKCIQDISVKMVWREVKKILPVGKVSTYRVNWSLV